MRKRNQPDVIKQVIKLYKLGISEKDIKAICDLSDEQLEEMLTMTLKVAKAKKSGELITNTDIVEALIKTAVGYNINETKTEEVYEKDGITLRNKIKTKITKNVGPQVQSIKYWLSIKDADWKDITEKVENDLNISVKLDGKNITIEKKINKK
jgi:DNA-binding transcriptional MerR regulator